VIAGLVAMAAANAAVVLGAASLLKAVRTGQAALDAVLFLLLRFLLISAAVLAAGACGVLTPAGLGIPSAVALVALLATRRLRDLKELRWPQPGRAVAIVGGIVALRLLLQVWFIAPHLGDPLAYHLPKIAEWVRAGGFTREMGVHPHVTFPAGFELLETWWVLFLRHDVLIEWAGAEFLVLGYFAVAALARSAGAPEREAGLAGLLFALSPTFHLSATSCLNDTPASALIAATMALASAGVHPALLLAAAGLGLGIKPTYGFALPGMILLAWICRKSGGLAPPRRFPAAALAAGALIVGAFWYARNLVWFGNPFYPLGSAGFVDPTPVQFGPRFLSLPENFVELIDRRVYDHSTLYGANADYMTGWGGAAFACGLIALPVSMARSPKFRAIGAAFLAALVSTLLLVQSDPFCLKYVSWFPAVLCVGAVLLADRIPGIVPVAWATLAFALVGTCLSYDFRREHLRTAIAQPWKERSAAAFAYGRITLDVPDPAVGYFGGPTGAAYLLYRPDYSRRVAYLRAKTEDALLQEARREGVAVLFAPGPTADQQRILENAVRQGGLRPLKSPFYAVEQVR